MVSQIAPKDAALLIDNGSVELIDVREQNEWIAGHIPGARHVPLSRLRQNPKAYLQRDKVVFVCAAGARSQLAAQLATAAGLSEVYNLTGGTRAWIANGYEMIVDTQQAAG